MIQCKERLASPQISRTGRGHLRFHGAHAGSTMVRAEEERGKTPAMYAGVTSTVAFIGPKRRWHPMFYNSLMTSAADANVLEAASSLTSARRTCGRSRFLVTRAGLMEEGE